MTNIEKKEKYIHEIAKILYSAKHPSSLWGLRLEDGTLINDKSESKEILGILGLFTPVEFAALVKDHDLEIKNYVPLYPYQIAKQEDGIYIEKCDPLTALQNGRHYAIVEGNKKASIYLNTKNDKTLSATIMERHEEGIYIYSSSSDEIRFLSNEKLKELCDNWRILLGEPVGKTPDEDIISSLTDSSALISLSSSGEVLANNISSGKQLDESRINYLFTLGIKEYMDMYAPRVTHAYETELETVADWTR